MNVKEMRRRLEQLESEGFGELQLLKFSDEEGNDINPVDAADVVYAEGYPPNNPYYFHLTEDGVEYVVIT